MTALQYIIKEAKIIRKKYPNKEWKECVAQASAIYASKHKGKKNQVISIFDCYVPRSWWSSSEITFQQWFSSIDFSEEDER